MGNDQPFQVIYPGIVRERIKSIMLLPGRHSKDEILSSLKKIDQRLMHQPRTFGEPLFSLPAIHLEVRLGAVHPLAAVYGVHQQENFVFVREFVLMG